LEFLIKYLRWACTFSYIHKTVNNILTLGLLFRQQLPIDLPAVTSVHSYNNQRVSIYGISKTVTVCCYSCYGTVIYEYITLILNTSGWLTQYLMKYHFAFFGGRDAPEKVVFNSV